MAITRFSGKYSFLSNFAPAKVKYGLHWYPTVEHAFQAAKTNDPAERRRIREAVSPGVAKRYGRTVNLRPDWMEKRVSVMQYLVEQKFRDARYRQMLLATGDKELVEENTWGDRFWGQCPVGCGKNYLGLILMDVRDKLRKETV